MWSGFKRGNRYIYMVSVNLGTCLDCPPVWLQTSTLMTCKLAPAANLSRFSLTYSGGETFDLG